MRRTTWLLVMVLGFALIAYGCSTSEATKSLNSQNEQAGALVEKDPAAAPETRQAGTDVKLNSQAMSKEIGKPEKPVTYSPKNSASDREKVPTKPWYKIALDNVWTFLGAFFVGGGAANLLGRFLPAAAGPWAGIATTLIGAIAKGRSAAETQTDGKTAMLKFLSILESELSDEGWQGQVKALAKKFEDENEIEHTVTLR